MGINCVKVSSIEGKQENRYCSFTENKERFKVKLRYRSLSKGGESRNDKTIY